jgi:hypothetical protein
VSARTLLLAAGLLALGAGCAHREAVRTPQPQPPAVSPLSKQVLGFYYGWYGRPETSRAWVHWTDVDEAARRIGSATHFPAFGAYDSHDQAILDQQVALARRAGLTGLIVSWWRQGDFQDRGLPALLDTAGRAGLKVTVYFEEVAPRNQPTPEGAAADLLYVLTRYAGHPAWLRVDGRPVVFVYSRAIGQLELEGWRSAVALVDQEFPGGAVFVGDRLTPAAARVFDGVHTYNPTSSTAGKSVAAIRAWAESTFPRWIELAGDDRIACLTVLAGYDDTKLGRAGTRPVTDRHDGETYRVMWEAAVAANPDWILICSWNEWHEGSEIEPSLENGDREIATTAMFSGRFLSTPLRTRIEPALADVR